MFLNSDSRDESHKHIDQELQGKRCYGESLDSIHGNILDLNIVVVEFDDVSGVHLTKSDDGAYNQNTNVERESENDLGLQDFALTERVSDESWNG